MQTAPTLTQAISSDTVPPARTRRRRRDKQARGAVDGKLRPQTVTQTDGAREPLLHAATPAQQEDDKHTCPQRHAQHCERRRHADVTPSCPADKRDKLCVANACAKGHRDASSTGSGGCASAPVASIERLQRVSVRHTHRGAPTAATYPSTDPKLRREMKPTGTMCRELANAAACSGSTSTSTSTHAQPPPFRAMNRTSKGAVVGKIRLSRKQSHKNDDGDRPRVAEECCQNAQ